MEVLYLELQDEHHDALKQLRGRSDVKGLARLSTHVSLIAGAGVLLAHSSGWWFWPAAFVCGVLVTFLFAPLHECLHNTAFRSRWLNEWVGWIVGVILVLPRDYFRCFHFAHHRYTQLPDRDPELAGPKLSTVAAFIRFVSGL